MVVDLSILTFVFGCTWALIKRVEKIEDDLRVLNADLLRLRDQ